jgi:hypothetical protein
MSASASPFTDHAAPVLAGEPTINDQQRADLWDAFHTKNADELVQHLQPLVLPEDFKKRLWDAKKNAVASAAPAEPVEKTAAAIQRMTQLDSHALELAEAHPNVLKAFTSAATAAEKGAGGAEPSNGAKTSPKSPAGGKDTQSAPLVQPDRPDGLPHLPPIDPAHFRVLASDGGIHDLPKENIEKARAIDPRLHVMNP